LFLQERALMPRDQPGIRILSGEDSVGRRLSQQRALPMEGQLIEVAD
jgi:hypothetical protein